MDAVSISRRIKKKGCCTESVLTDSLYAYNLEILKDENESGGCWIQLFFTRIVSIRCCLSNE